jgi:hypothetical protein
MLVEPSVNEHMWSGRTLLGSLLGIIERDAGAEQNLKGNHFKKKSGRELR